MRGWTVLFLACLPAAGCSGGDRSGTPQHAGPPGGSADSLHSATAPAPSPIPSDTGVVIPPNDFQPARDGRMPAAAPAFRRIDAGLEWFDGTVETGGRGGPIRLSVVRVAVPQPGIQLAVTRNRKAGGQSLEAYRKESGARVALSGGFLKSFYPPIPTGFVQSAGQAVNRPSPDPMLDGMLLVRRGQEVDMVRAAARPEVTAWDDALQSGPLLVMGGRAVVSPSGPERVNEIVTRRFIRAFVAVDRTGRILLGMTGKVSLPDLAGLLARDADQGGLGCRTALNLSGHINAGLVVSAGDADFRIGDTTTLLPDAILVP